MTATYEFTLDSYGGSLTPLILDQDNAIVNLANASELKFIFEKPDGTRVEKSGTKFTDGTDGRALYVFIVNDLDQSGVWYYWVRVVNPYYRLYSSKKTFMVVEV